MWAVSFPHNVSPCMLAYLTLHCFCVLGPTLSLCWVNVKQSCLSRRWTVTVEPVSCHGDCQFTIRVLVFFLGDLLPAYQLLWKWCQDVWYIASKCRVGVQIMTFLFVSERLGSLLFEQCRQILDEISYFLSNSCRRTIFLLSIIKALKVNIFI